MPLENNLNNPTSRYQKSSSVMNIPIDSCNSINQMPTDEIKALTHNATISRAALSQSSSVVKKNFQDLQRLSSLNKQIRFKVEDQELGLCIKAPEVNRDLPILFMKNIKDTIDLSEPLPGKLQKAEKCTTILDLLRASFPQLTSFSFFNKDTKIPRFVTSSPIPLNYENKGNFFPQIESEGQIAYIAWDSSSSQIAKGFKEKTCDILLKNKEAFCGVALSQANVKRIEEVGESAYFMTTKVTVVGVLITKLPAYTQSWWLGDGRIACDGPGLSSRIASDSYIAECSDHVISRSLSKGEMINFGMLGVQGISVSNAKQELPDRFKNRGEKLIPFCLEIIPQFSSEENPVQKDDLVMAIDMQFQKKAFTDLSKP